MDPTLKQLLARAREGDKLALDELLLRMRPHLQATARRFANPRHPDEGVSDLVQEAGMAAWQKLHEFEGISSTTRGSTDPEREDARERRLIAWLRQIVRRFGIDRHRAAHAQRRNPVAGLASLDAPRAADESLGIAAAGREPSPSSEVAQREAEAIIAQTLANLADETDRQLVQLVFADNLSLRKAAEQLQLTYDQVRHRFHKLLARLEQELRELK